MEQRWCIFAIKMVRGKWNALNSENCCALIKKIKALPWRKAITRRHPRPPSVFIAPRHEDKGGQLPCIYIALPRAQEQERATPPAHRRHQERDADVIQEAFPVFWLLICARLCWRRRLRRHRRRCKYLTRRQIPNEPQYNTPSRNRRSDQPAQFLR